MKDRKKVVLQSHMDMVGEKNSDVDHDFEDPTVKPRIDDGWVKAEGTTLGADDGIGIAAQLAVLASGLLNMDPLNAFSPLMKKPALPVPSLTTRIFQRQDPSQPGFRG